MLASITSSSIQRLYICETWGMMGVYIESRLQSSSYGPQNGDYSHCVCVKNTPMCLQLCHNNPAERRLNNQSSKGFRDGNSTTAGIICISLSLTTPAFKQSWRIKKKVALVRPWKPLHPFLILVSNIAKLISSARIYGNYMLCLV